LAARLSPDPLGELAVLPQSPYLYWGKGRGRTGRGEEDGTGRGGQGRVSK